MLALLAMMLMLVQIDFAKICVSMLQPPLILLSILLLISLMVLLLHRLRVHQARLCLQHKCRSLIDIELVNELLRLWLFHQVSALDGIFSFG
mmetsp:Transcript_62701/g.91920  ORF Transcript_62701/g.91920 Transcript_62701/m.91920 type:complete len:92 (-) Transcript_62701:348-623(-)